MVFPDGPGAPQRLPLLEEGRLLTNHARPAGDATISLPAAELHRSATHGTIFCFLAVQRYGAARPAE